MALSFQNVALVDVAWSMITDIKIRAQGSGTLTSVGMFTNASMNVAALTKRGDPTDTEYTYALRFSVDFTILQSKKTGELAAMAGTSGTGMLETDAECAVTFAGGRVITLGAVSGYPMRIAMSFVGGGDDEAQKITCHGEAVELLTAFAAKVSA